jgi:ribosomal RNA-processing protein 9
MLGDVETGKKLHRFNGTKLKKYKKEKTVNADGHTGHVLAVAVSSDGNYLVSGGMDRTVRLWDLRSYTLIEKLKGHRGAVTVLFQNLNANLQGLRFKQNSNSFYSASEDRTIRVWDAGSRGFIDSLYGHQAEVLALDTLAKDRAVSVGKDKSVRYWKIPEETQLLFEPPKAKSLLEPVHLAHPRTYLLIE